MPEIIDAKGLACPQPVILTKKALEKNDEIIILLDNSAACDNVKRFASKSGCIVDVTEEPDRSFRVQIRKQASGPGACEVIAESPPSGERATAVSGMTVFVIASDVMGSGDDDLGAILMKAFIHTTTELDRLPEIMVLYNTGVKLVASESDVIDDLRLLEGKGVRIMVCGTCANYFKLGEKLGAGSISNMYDIAAVLTEAGRIVRP